MTFVLPAGSDIIMVLDKHNLGKSLNQKRLINIVHDSIIKSCHLGPPRTMV